MKRCTFGWTAVLIAAVLAGGSAPPAAVAGEKFTLASAVPDDVFMYIAESRNPEREFIHTYWQDVLDEVLDAGIGTDLMELLGSLLGEEGMAEVERFKALATQLLEGVDWDQLDAREFVYAMRMPKADTTGGGFSVAGADMTWMFRGGEGSGAKNFAGLTAILEAIAAEANKAAGDEFLSVTVKEEAGGKIARLGWPMPPNKPYDLQLAQRGDLLIMAMGGTMMPEVLGLLGGQGSAKSLSEDARFKAAFAKLPPAEDTMFYFDMQQMVADIEELVDGGFKAAGFEPHMQVDVKAPPGKNTAVLKLNAKAVEAYNKQDYAGALEYVKQAHEIDPTDATVLYNLGCFSALVGEKEAALGWVVKAVDAGFDNGELMASDSDLESIRQEPEFQKALGKAYGNSANKNTEWMVGVKRVADRIIEMAAMLDHVAAIEYTEGYTTHMDSAAVLSADAASKPFYPVIGSRKPLTDFARFLPQETVSFSVSSMIDLDALYTFLEDSVRTFGPGGEEALAKWEGLQKQIEFNVRKDLLSWIQGDSISVTLPKGPTGMPDGVWLVRVNDEAAAKEKVSAGLNFISSAMQEMAAQQPFLAMMALRVSPCTNEKLEGFQTIQMGMNPQQMVCGTAEGHLIFGTSADAVVLCLDTAAGAHPNVTKNDQVMAEALTPKGSFNSVTFTDKRELGNNIAQALGMVSMVGMFIPMAIPEPEMQQAAAKVLGMIAKLVPAAQKINFYKSSASYTTFDGKVYLTREITNYFSPTEREGRTTAAAIP